MKIEHNGHTIEKTTEWPITKGVWTKPDGSEEEVEGTWALGPGYSWYAQGSKQWVVVDGSWQV